MPKKNLSSNNGFEVAAELLWRLEIITIPCITCKSKGKCYSPFLTAKSKYKIEITLHKIRICKIRLSNLEF